MIMHLQIFAFLLFGFMSWHGMDNYFKQREQVRISAVMMNLTLYQLTNLDIRQDI